MIPTNLDYEVIEIDTGNVCQLKCPTCNRQDKDFDEHLKYIPHLGVDDFQTLIEKFPNVNRFFLGLMFDEPTFNPNLIDIVKFLKSQNKYITINTNGCNDKNFSKENWKELVYQLKVEDRIVWSMDGLTSETYLQHRKNGNFKKLLTNITYVTNLKKFSGPLNIIQIIKFEHNKEEIELNFESFKSRYNRLWCKPFWDIIESNGQCTIPTDKVQSTWDINKQLEIKETNYTSNEIIKRCTTSKESLTLFVAHNYTLGFCLPNLISNLKEPKPIIKLTDSIEVINEYIKDFYLTENLLINKTCQFYCGKEAIDAKSKANLDYTIT